MSRKIRVAIIGVGNCANALVQGIQFYRGINGEGVAGLMHPNIGGYKPDDIEVVAAFDVAASKVGKPLAEAIWAAPNDTWQFTTHLDHSPIVVQRGPTLDGFGRYLKDIVPESDAPSVQVDQVLRDAEVDVVINYLPVGSEAATRHYAEAALAAGCGFVNCIPVFLASDPTWADRFRDAGLPIVGDDIKSQVGATIIHRVLVDLFKKRGVRLDRTMQLNVGGNSDFLNMLERDRLQSKKVSKTQAVTSIAGVTLPADDVHVGPSDHVPWLSDRKWAYIRLEGTAFGGAPLNIELKAEVWDSPNSAGVVIDAVRCAQLAKQRGEGGPLLEASAYYMKSPAVQITDDTASNLLEVWLSQE